MGAACSVMWNFVRRLLGWSAPTVDEVLRPEITRLLWQVQGTGEVPLSSSLGEPAIDVLLVNGFVEQVGWNPQSPRYRVTPRGWHYVQHGRTPEAKVD